MKKRKRVALLIETSNSYARGLLEGIIAYVHEYDSWSVFVPETGRGDTPPKWLSHWKGNGIIARIENGEIAETILQTGLPVVDVSSARMIPDIPWVETNDAAIAGAAAAHLLERGFRNLAFCGDPRFNWSKWRAKSFCETARKAGVKVREYRAPKSLSWEREQSRLKDWVLRLPRPVGIMACYDMKGQALLNACRDLEIAVPEEVAVIGVDNDPLICELCMPRLSSVVSDSHRTGYIAAQLLDRMLVGGKVRPSAYLIDPLGVHTRQSTDILLIEDRDVVAAIRFIRQHACDGIRIGDVLREVPLSRRMLESRFVKYLGRTPHREIERVRMERVKSLLRETDLPLSAIARHTGFSNEYYLSAAFKRVTRRSPRDYRCETSQGRRGWTNPTRKI